MMFPYSFLLAFAAEKCLYAMEFHFGYFRSVVKTASPPKV